MLVFTHGFTSSPRSTAFFASKPAPIITLGLLVLVQEVMAAMTTLPCVRSKRVPACSTGTSMPDCSGWTPKPCGPTGAVSPLFHTVLHLLRSMRSCGRFGPARLGRTVLMSSSSVSLNCGRDRLRRVEQPLLLAIAFDQFHLLLAAPGAGQIAQRLGVDGEEADGGAIFRGHVADGRPVRQAQVLQPRAEELDELAHHALPCATSPSRAAPGRWRWRPPAARRSVKAHDLRQQHVDRLAQHHGLGLDAAHAPAQHAQAVDHGRVAVGAH